LKRCVVGGIEKVFEINRNFRNEGSDSSHSPEFAMLEIYEAYADYNDMAELTRRIIQEAAERVTGSQVVTWYDGTEDDSSGEWASRTVSGSLSVARGTEITPAPPVETLRKYADEHGGQVDSSCGHGKLVGELWEHLVGNHLHGPTFVREFPVETGPL